MGHSRGAQPCVAGGTEPSCPTAVTPTFNTPQDTLRAQVLRSRRQRRVEDGAQGPSWLLRHRVGSAAPTLASAAERAILGPRLVACGREERRLPTPLGRG
ncbi:hypothetical protein P7K49_032887 [Saguinus oedipus]|uniref:Uncharacterized protein n=1 Tax=Saguinus oedipus TaxID=9490 RepID=A0ABQ9TR40_SAGOE|nr:hypothetical protein P7K49_032887 [Saguinus oedipus]